jgi:uncharacterized protein (DUF1697 family)
MPIYQTSCFSVRPEGLEEVDQTTGNSLTRSEGVTRFTEILYIHFSSSQWSSRITCWLRRMRSDAH